MISLYRALVKKLNHEHEFELIADVNVRENPNDTNPVQIIKTYMCKCGKVKKVTIERTVSF